MTGEYALFPGGKVIKYLVDETLYIGGQFTEGGTIGVLPNDQSDYIAQWNGEAWDSLNSRYHIYDPCAFCGQNVTVGVDACRSCGAPTADWWVHLDQMLAEWQQGTRGR